MNAKEKTSAAVAVKLRCKYCSIQETCVRKKRKERYEESGIVTYCTITPDQKKRGKKRR